MKILIIEDELNLLESIVNYLEGESYRCEHVSTFDAGFQKINLYEYDCILLDIGLPDGNGLHLIKDIKPKHPSTGLIIISAKNSLDDKINGLDLGADDYLTKPFHLPELNSRIKSVLRRIKFNGQKELTIDKLRVLPENRQAFWDNELLSLTKKEFDLLIFLITNVNRVLTKESIAEHLWGDFVDSSDSFDFVYSHIKNLRRKLLEKSGIDYIQNIYGTGYSFTDK